MDDHGVDTSITGIVAHEVMDDNYVDNDVVSVDVIEFKPSNSGLSIIKEVDDSYGEIVEI